MAEKNEKENQADKENKENKENIQFKFLNKKDWMILAIVCSVVFLIGLVLILKGLNRAFYSENATIRSIFNIFTELGGEMAYVILIPLVIFAIDFKFGKKLLVGFMISSFFNSLLKYIINDPRPPTNIVDGHPIEDSPGFPSGHSQSAIAFWGFTLYYNKIYSKNSLKDRLLQILCIFLMTIIPISRVIIGVHDIDDIIGGVLIGFLILIIYLEILPKIKIFSEKTIVWKICVGTCLSVAFWLIFAILFPSAAESIGQASGLLIAAAIGYPIEEKYIKFNNAEFNTSKRIISGVLGILITMIMHFGLSFAFGLIDNYAWIFRCVRYAILGLVIIVVVPLIICKIFRINRH
ncbi:MAG: phosphatase PAP2 family protein [Promethearchaeota archaeon]